jgi:hypothetical protein
MQAMPKQNPDLLQFGLACTHSMGLQYFSNYEELNLLCIYMFEKETEQLQRN